MFSIFLAAGRWLSRHPVWVFSIALVAATVVIVFQGRGEKASDVANRPEDLPSPPLPQPNRLRTQLVNQVAADPPERLLDNLVEKLDDIANAEFGAMLPPDLGPGSYQYGRAVVPKFARVRRILQVTQGEARRKLSPKLEKMLTDAVHNFQKAYDEYNIENFEVSRHGKIVEGPSKAQEYTRRTTNANVATYLLAEFRSFESLPVMAKVFENPRQRSPVSRLFVFYAMHTLALEHPRKGLSREAAAALDDYLAATRNKIPAPVEVSRPGWNAPVDESDFRVTVLGKKLPVEKMPQVRLREYPPEFGNLEDVPRILVRADHGIAREVYGWYAKLVTFITLAYPKAPNK